MSSSAQSWSVKGIDPKVREAAREAAARQGMSLGEYLSQALMTQGAEPTSTPAPRAPSAPGAVRVRSQRFGGFATYDEEEDDWSLGGPAPRVTDPTRLAQRIESIERRTQLAVTGLDRAVSTIDRSVLGLAARVEDAEALAGENADRVAEAMESFLQTGDTLSGQVSESRDALDRAREELAEVRERLGGQISSAQNDLLAAKERLEHQVATAEEVAKRAEATATYLANELQHRDVSVGQKLSAAEERQREAMTQTLAQARAFAEEAARNAAEASADAVLELRALQDRLADRLEESEQSTRHAIETAVAETRAGQDRLAQRIAGAEFEARGVKESLLEEVVRLESTIGSRIAAAEQLKAEQAALIARIEKAEAGSREATAGLRQAAGAAIADLRNAQLGLASRVKQVEETAGRSGAVDLSDIRAHQQEITERLSVLETKTNTSPMEEALSNFEKRLDDIAQRQQTPSTAFDDFEKRLSELAQRQETPDPALAHVERRLDDLTMRVEQPSAATEQVKTLDEALQRLASRLAETENSANNAIRTLEDTVANLGERVEQAHAEQETEALRTMLEQRLDAMAQSVTTMVDQARTELTGQMQAAIGGEDGEGMEGALADVNRRLAAAERRQAQTIEAISIEIKRMSETIDKRLRTVEARNDDAAGSAVREELSKMGQNLERRFDEIERREAAAFDRMGLEVGRLSERLEERVGAVEQRSAQAIEHVGEQVARMAERFNQRHDLLARDLGERMLDSEERAGARVNDAISSIMQRISEVEEQSTEAVAPVRKAVSGVASRLEALETGKDSLLDDDIPTPSRRMQDFAPEPSPMEAAQPVRAAPLAPAAIETHGDEPLGALESPILIDSDHDIYFAEDIHADEPAQEPSMFGELEDASLEAPAPSSMDFGDDELMIEDAIPAEVDAFAPPPPEDDDPFWSPDEPSEVAEAAISAASAPVEEKAASKNDYLAAARKAAQAQAATGKTGKKKDVRIHDVPPTPTYSLRGSSRIVLWGAIGATALLVAGGAWYVNAQKDAQVPPPAPTPAPTGATQHATPAENFDPSAPAATAPADPFPPTTDSAASTPAAPVTAAPTPAPSSTTPAVQRTTAAPVVAGPLPTRSVSLDAAAHGGDAVAQYELALQRISSNKAGEGVGLLRSAADRGLAMAQYRLAKMYERGEGVTADLTQARQWTERAAAAGNKRAMHDLGVYFARGEGAPLDEAAAFRWFRQAAELGVADSQFNLGVLYQQGRGVNASASEAMFWFLVAARQGDGGAQARATALQSSLQPIQVDQARARAEAFRPRAASAIANGEFGPRPWSNAAASAAAPARPAA